MGSYLPSTNDERKRMLHAIGLEQMEQLFADVPSQVLLKNSVNIPNGLSEMEVRERMEALADENIVFKTVLRGAGAYDHYIPAIVSSVTAKEEFATTYTPYQAEISQGVLQSIFEYQTMISELTGMDVSNASVYDGASAAAEAVMMCVNKQRNKVFAASTAHPDVLSTIKTYCWGRGLDFQLIPEKNGITDTFALKEMGEDAACVFMQQPNFYGLFEDAEIIVEKAHAAGAKAIMGVYPISLGMCKTPAEYNADIAVGEGQPLGLPMNFGGPYLGFMTAKREMLRSLPGRIVGETTDNRGQRAFVLTLQAREQHIRREKASSNVCTNQALCAMTASVYMAAMGPQGIHEVANLCWQKAYYFADLLTKEVKGFERTHTGEFFNEFMTACPMDPKEFELKLMKKGILCGLPVDGKILWCVTEKSTKETLDRVIDLIREVCEQ